MSYLRKLPSGRWRAEVEASGQRESLTRLSRRVDILTLQRISGHIDVNQLACYFKESPADIAKRL